MNTYSYFKGLIPQPEFSAHNEHEAALDFRPRYGNRVANQRARGALHPVPASSVQPRSGQPLPCRCC